jgi:hypothetical protein
MKEKVMCVYVTFLVGSVVLEVNNIFAPDKTKGIKPVYQTMGSLTMVIFYVLMIFYSCKKFYDYFRKGGLKNDKL